MSYLVLDLETGSKKVKGRAGNPFHNSILCYGLKYPEYHIAKAGDELPKGFLNNITTLIGHNIKYDLLYLWRNEELQEAFKGGLKIWDTQLTEYILSGQKHKYPKLRDIAVNKYGCKERVKNIDEMIVQGLSTYDMDIKDLLEDVTNDVLDTEQVALQQVKIAKDTGIYALIQAQMDAVLATTEMEYNGLYVSKTRLRHQKMEIERQLDEKYKELEVICQRYWK